MLDIVEFKRNDAVGIVDVADIVFGGSPVCEVEFLANLTEGMAGFLDRLTFKDCQWGFSFQEELDLWMLFHCEWKKEGTMGYGTDVEAETEAGGLAAGVVVAHDD